MKTRWIPVLRWMRSPGAAWLLGLACLSLASASHADTYQYDALGRLTRVDYSTGGSTVYTYDANGNLLSAVSTSTPAGVEPPKRPLSFRLDPSFPDPAVGIANTRFAIPSRQRVSLRVFDLSGRAVAILMSGMLDAGEYTARFEGGGRAAGIYFFRLRGAQGTINRRFVLVR